MKRCMHDVRLKKGFSHKCTQLLTYYLIFQLSGVAMSQQALEPVFGVVMVTTVSNGSVS